MSEKLSSETEGKEGRKYIAKVRLSMIREDTAGRRIVINGPEDVASLDFIKDELILNDRESFICLHLNIKHCVLSYEVVSIGSLNSSVVHPREVYKGALLSNAAAIIILHNHPSGDPTPSAEDITVTKRLIDAGNILGIELLDHLIFGESGFISLKERELL